MARCDHVSKRWATSGEHRDLLGITERHGSGAPCMRRYVTPAPAPRWLVACVGSLVVAFDGTTVMLAVVVR